MMSRDEFAAERLGSGSGVEVWLSNGDCADDHPTIVKPNLSHIDFWPACQADALAACEGIFEPFGKLLDRANRWICQFDQFEVLCCETVEKKVMYVKDIYSASMDFKDPQVDDDALAVDIKGLRLWYHQHAMRGHYVPASLAYMDTMPFYLNPGEKHPRFESRQHTVDRVNEQLMQNPLPGRIISVETVAVKIAKEDWSSHMNLRALQEQTHWFDEYNCHQLSFLRIFYARGVSAEETIGLEDIAPDAIDEGGIFHPAKYQSFSTLVSRAAQWLCKSTGIRTTNIQTLNTKHRKKSENQGKRFNTDKMFEFRIEERFRAYFLRVGYVRAVSRSLDPEADPLPPVPRIVCKTFLPAKTVKGINGEGRYENITEVLQRVTQDLRTTGCRIFHIETVSLPEWITNPDMCEFGERTFFDGEWYFNQDKDGNDVGPYRYTLVYAIRVYFDAPPAHPMLQHQVSSPQDSNKLCCVVS